LGRLLYNYRPIAVIQVLSKVFALVLNNRLTVWAEQNDKRKPSQAGFRPVYGTELNSFVLHHLIVKYKFQHKSLHCCYVDLRKAYDSTIRQHVWDRLYDLGVKGKMLHALAAFYRQVTFSVKFNEGLSEAFEANVGVRQGCPLSPFLFGVFIEILHDMIHDFMKDLNIELGGRLGESAARLLVPLLMFADDIVLIAESAADLQRLLDILADFCTHHKMCVNFGKTKVVVYHATYQKAKDRKHAYHIGGRLLEVASEYKYLGLLTPARNTTENMAAAVADRGKAAQGALFKRYAHLGIDSNALLKRNLFDAIVVPNLTYGCEVWGPWLLNAAVGDHAFDNAVEAVRVSFYRN
jgi:hypothetical protein